MSFGTINILAFGRSVCTRHLLMLIPGKQPILTRSDPWLHLADIVSHHLAQVISPAIESTCSVGPMPSKSSRSSGNWGMAINYKNPQEIRSAVEITAEADLSFPNDNNDSKENTMQISLDSQSYPVLMIWRLNSGGNCDRQYPTRDNQSPKQVWAEDIFIWLLVELWPMVGSKNRMAGNHMYIISGKPGAPKHIIYWSSHDCEVMEWLWSYGMFKNF